MIITDHIDTTLNPEKHPGHQPGVIADTLYSVF